MDNWVVRDTAKHTSHRLYLTLNLTGDSAKAIFERAGLPNEVLGRIWNLSDREGKGSLDQTEFIIAMHLVTCSKSRVLTALPTVLPPALYEAAARRGAPPPLSSRQPPIGSAPTAIPRQFTGPQARAQSPLSRAPFGTPPPMAAQTTGSNWLITPQEKVKYDQFFAGIDTAGAGYLDGEHAVKFFSDSGLPEDDLASIWDLADINSEGRLSRDEFAVAMYLIKQQRGRPSGSAIPAFLPAALVPPSMRNQARSAPQPTAPAFDNAANASQLPKSATEDLFGLDASPEQSKAVPVQPPAPVQIQQMTGGSAAAFSAPFTTESFGGGKPSSPTIAQRGFTAAPPQGPSSMFKPFMPSSAFGATLAAQNTGGSNISTQPQQRSVQPQAASAMDDLLGDSNEEETRNITSDTSELANMSSQIGNLRNQMQDVQTKKTTNERDLSASSQQKRDLEQRLAQFRAQYEQEVQTVKTLDEQLARSRNETKTLQQNLAMIEGSHQDLRNQHQQVAQALEADQRENAGLKQRISQLNAEVAELKPLIEKMRSDARQQKGMVAINKKQVTTNEGERDKLNTDISEFKSHAEENGVLRTENERLQDETEQLRVAHNRSEQSRVEQERLHQEQLQQERSRLEQLQQEHLEQQRLHQEQLQQERMHQEQLYQEQLQQERMQHERLQQERLQQEHSHQERAIPEQQEHSRDITSPEPASIVISPAPSINTNPFFRKTSTRDEGTMSPGAMASAHSTSAFDALFGPSFASQQPSSTSTPPQTSFARESLPTFSGAASGPSVSSDGRPTPSDTPPMSSATQDDHIPPMVPESRQFTPGNLPLRRVLSREDSVDSSVRALPPGSRLGGTETPSYFEQDNRSVTAGSIVSPFESNTHAFGNPSLSHENVTTPPAQTSGPALQAEQQQETREIPQHNEDPDSMPGAFPTTPMFPQSTGNSLTARDQTSTATSANHDDFDSAFAGFNDEQPTQPKGKERAIDAFEPVSQEAQPVSRGFGHEFPPIQSLEHDEDTSDSESERGFGNSVATDHVRTNGTAADLAPVTSEHIEHAFPAVPGRLGLNTDVPTASELPQITAQVSPPTYEDTVSPNGTRSGSNNFPPEFGGLLPSREDPTQSSVPYSIPQSHHTPMASASGSDFYQDATSRPVSNFTVMGGASSTVAPAHPGSGNPAFDDEFADFDDLAEAKEANEDVDFGSTTRSVDDEFNPTFDSPAQSTIHTISSPQETPTVRSAPFASSGFHGFGSSMTSQPTISTFPESASPQPQQNHDWDAIFSSLDAPAPNVQPSFSNAVEDRDTFSSVVDDDAPTPKAMSPQAQSSSARNLPKLGRAVSSGTEHDDPILKRLTGMGYPRTAALDALEKYDYDINRVRET